jgi:hypothetical protein
VGVLLVVVAGYLGLCVAVNTASPGAGVLVGLVLAVAVLLGRWDLARRAARRHADPGTYRLGLLARAHYYYELGRTGADGRPDDDPGRTGSGPAQRRRPGDDRDPAGPAAPGEHSGHDAAADPVNIWAAPR